MPVRGRHDGWNADRQRRFITALAETQCVGKACRAVGLSRESAYRLRRRPDATSFDAAWAAVMERKHAAGRGDPLSLVRRAWYGSERKIIRGGKVVATVYGPDNRAAMALIHRMDQAHRSSKRMRARLRRGGISPRPEARSTETS